MTRQEEIQKLIDEEMGIDNYGSCDFQVGVCYGVKYADKTMIKKAKAWVKNCFIGPFGEGLADNIANEFVKYLEEEI